MAFCDNWVYPYGPPAYLLSDNGGQFASKYFQSICRILGIRNLFTTAYHPQANGQVERFNRTLLSGLRQYVAEHQKDWPEYVGPLTYAYNTQVHRSTGCKPFELVLPRVPEPLAMELTLSEEGVSTPRQERTRFRDHLRNLMSTATERLRQSQERYKRNFDSRVRRTRQGLEVGHYVFLQRETHNQTDSEGQRMRRKLLPVADGPFKVVKLDENTVTILRDGLLDRVSKDRISRAPLRTLTMDDNLDDNPETTEGSSNSEVGLQPQGTNADNDLDTEGTNGDRGTQSDPSVQHDDEIPRSSSPELEGQSNGGSINEHVINPSQPPLAVSHSSLADALAEGTPTTQRGIITRQSTNAEVSRQNDYVVDTILEYNRRTRKFKVRWEGYGPEQDTWEPSRHLPYNLVAQHFRRQKCNLPTHMRHFLDVSLPRA